MSRSFGITEQPERAPTRWRSLLALVVCVLALMPAVGWSQQGAAPAQEGEEVEPELESPEATYRVVVLDPLKGGGEALRERVAREPKVEVRDQAWFLEELQRQGIRPAQILSRPKDLRWAMGGAEIDYIMVVYFNPQEEGAKPEGRLIDAQAEVVARVPLKPEVLEEGLPPAAVEEMVAAAAARFTARREAARDAIAAREAVKRQEELALQRKDEQIAQMVSEARAAQQRRLYTMADASDAGWVRLTAGGVLLSRELKVSGLNRNLLSYRSQPYPGYALSFAIYPMASAGTGSAGLGFYADATHGFDSFTAVSPDGSAQALTATWLQLGAGVSYRLLGPRAGDRHLTRASFDVRLGGHYDGYLVDANDALPPTSGIRAELGALFVYPLVHDLLALEAGLDLSPYGARLEGAEEFGGGDYSYGAETFLGLQINLWEEVYARLGYRLSMMRTLYEGRGSRGFVDADAFDFTQGGELGVMAWF